MNKTINFDMDGTIANLYNVPNWLSYLIAEDATPYAIAEPLVNMSALARILNRLKREGYTINIISWASKNGSATYNSVVEKVKKAWLKKHLKSVTFDNIFVVPYGTPKHTLASGILFDDELKNREAWGENAYNEYDMMDVLRAL